jgi:hypothetical protein
MTYNVFRAFASSPLQSSTTAVNGLFSVTVCRLLKYAAISSHKLFANCRSANNLPTNNKHIVQTEQILSGSFLNLFMPTFILYWRHAQRIVYFTELINARMKWWGSWGANIQLIWWRVYTYDYCFHPENHVSNLWHCYVFDCYHSMPIEGLLRKNSDVVDFFLQPRLVNFDGKEILTHFVDCMQRQHGASVDCKRRAVEFFELQCIRRGAVSYKFIPSSLTEKVRFY